MKKALKIVGVIVLIVFVLLLVIPYAFQSQIKDAVKNYVNQNLNAHVEFSDVSLSLLKRFPHANVTVKDLAITNFAPFEGDTLASSKSISFTMSAMELFKSDDDPLVVNSINIDEASVALKTDARGNKNYDIGKSKEGEEKQESPSTESKPFSLDVEDYSLRNSALTYIDEASNTVLQISELNHSGKASYSAEKSVLDSKTEADVSLSLDSVQYLNNNSIKLDALIDMDFDSNTYTFKDNKAFINQLPLEFTGYVQQLEEGQKVNIAFENPGSSFKDFLAVIPETYSKNIADVETTGNFKVKGVIKGLVTDKTIPTIDVNITSNNASFKYPDLPKKVENITINTTIKNTTGNTDDTYIDLNALNFKIDNDVFKSSATLKNITKNMLVNANIDGTLNLANISKVYPIQMETPLSGLLRAKLHTVFDMDAIETNAYERIKNSGSASLTGFTYTSKDMVNPVEISRANITFTPEVISLNTFEAKSGQSDVKVTGSMRNLIGFLLSKNDLQGNFDVSSNMFVLNDFMAKEKDSTTTTTKTSKKEALKIPKFLDCTLNADAKTVVYDNLDLKDVKGTLTIKDQQASIKGLTCSLFDGVLAVTGDVSTKSDVPTFNMNLGA
ncbi:MAG TPA: AsmA family protein, partial [Flavobacteriaceae bacterium]|nr:AsmA family protein [Flavobacteriaceae bacterium]